METGVLATLTGDKAAGTGVGKWGNVELVALGAAEATAGALWRSFNLRAAWDKLAVGPKRNPFESRIPSFSK